MRLNQFLARHTDLSRRSADAAIQQGRVEVNGVRANIGAIVIDSDKITLDGRTISQRAQTQTIMLHKPIGFVCSRQGQGSKTIYDLLPPALHHLNPVGRLDKDSSGLLLLTNDGELANQLTHPRYNKEKVYEVTLDRPLSEPDRKAIQNKGVDIGDERPSIFRIQDISNLKRQTSSLYRIAIIEGRNRQIRRTFAALGYKVIKLHRSNFDNYSLQDLKDGEFSVII